MWPVCFSITSGQDATLTVGKKKMKPFISRWVAKRYEKWRGVELGEGQHGCVFCYSSPFVKPWSPWPTMGRAGQLWTDGWHTTGQYVMPGGDLQGMRRFALQHSQCKFTEKRKLLTMKRGFSLDKNAENNILALACSFSAREFHNSDQPTLDPNLWY